MSLPKDSVLPAGSLVVVTGTNGFVGSYVADELLRYGFRVRGTVRDAAKSAWLNEQLEKSHGSGKFELVEVKDFKAPGALDESLKGADGLIHVASDLSFGTDPKAVIDPTVLMINRVLESADKQPSIKRVVYTSSSAAASGLKWNEPYDLTEKSWNESSVQRAWSGSKDDDMGFHVYCASKTQTEQALWKYMEEKKPHFVANSVLPDYICGAPFNVAKQGYPSSIALFKALWEGDKSFLMLPPAWAVDVRDTAKLHVAALVRPDAKGERVFAYAANKRWTEWIEYLREEYPDRTFPDPPENEGTEMANITRQPRSEELLKWLTGKGYRPMKESIKELADTLV